MTRATHGLVERVLAVAASDPARPALLSLDHECSYGALAERVGACCLALRHRGVQPGTTVAFQCADEFPHLTLSLALMALGCRQLAVASHESGQAGQSLALQAGASLFLQDGDAVELAAHSPASPASGAPANAGWLYLSTSGTTGRPKVVMMQEQDLVAQAPRHILGPQERFACMASVEHNFAKRHRLYCLAMGATTVFLPTDRKRFVDACVSLGVTTLHVSVFQAQELLGLDQVARLHGIRLKLGGSHASHALRQALIEQVTPALYAGYGTTETGAIGFAEPDEHASASVGRPLPGLQVQIVDALRQPLPQGERGEVAVCGQGLFRGYLNEPELTRQRCEAGWFYTGDIGELDAKGRLTLSGRADDMFVFNSMNIYPQELEAVIREFPGVQIAAVFPRPSATHGGIPVALVESADPALDLKALRRFVQQRVGLRCPRQFLRVHDIPRNSAGKIRRERLSAIAGGGSP